MAEKIVNKRTEDAKALFSMLPIQAQVKPSEGETSLVRQAEVTISYDRAGR